MAGIHLQQRVRRYWKKLSQIDARPDQIAAGFSIGIAASFVPLNPSPIIMASVVAWLLKRNVVAAIAGATAAILYTPLLPLMWLAEYRLGKLILPVRHAPILDPARLWFALRQGGDVYLAMSVGSIVIATPLTLLTYVVVKRLAERWARKRGDPQRSD